MFHQCRICLNISNEKCLRNIFAPAYTKLLHELECLLGIKFKREASLPTHICQYCVKNINSVLNYTQFWAKVQHQLQTQLYEICQDSGLSNKSHNEQPEKANVLNDAFEIDDDLLNEMLTHPNQEELAMNAVAVLENLELPDIATNNTMETNDKAVDHNSINILSKQDEITQVHSSVVQLEAPMKTVMSLTESLAKHSFSTGMQTNMQHTAMINCTPFAPTLVLRRVSLGNKLLLITQSKTTTTTTSSLHWKSTQNMIKAHGEVSACIPYNTENKQLTTYNKHDQEVGSKDKIQSTTRSVLKKTTEIIEMIDAKPAKAFLLHEGTDADVVDVVTVEGTQQAVMADERIVTESPKRALKRVSRNKNSQRKYYKQNETKVSSSDVDTEGFACRYCNRIFRSKRCRGAHMRVHPQR